MARSLWKRRSQDPDQRILDKRFMAPEFRALPPDVQDLVRHQAKADDKQYERLNREQRGQRLKVAATGPLLFLIFELLMSGFQFPARLSLAPLFGVPVGVAWSLWDTDTLGSSLLAMAAYTAFLLLVPGTKTIVLFTAPFFIASCAAAMAMNRW